MKERLVRFWKFLHTDSWQSWLVSCILIIISIKFILFPVLAFVTGTSLPLVVVESCSMYHAGTFEDWWQANNAWYENRNIYEKQFNEYPFKNGLAKGDIILVTGAQHAKKGDVIIFSAPTKYPVIHRLISQEPAQTKGDHNPDQLPFEHDIASTQVIGKATLRIPLLGWVKLIFFEPLKPADQRGFCKP